MTAITRVRGSAVHPFYGWAASVDAEAGTRVTVRGADGAFTEASMNVFISVLVIPIAVQWWSVWYPGAEPGGGSYVAQRMLAAKDERHSLAATLWFNVAHYALRPWPWIIVATHSERS